LAIEYEACKFDKMKFRNVLGIDFGGSGIKGAPVDTKKGKLLDKRYRIPTPSPASPAAVADVINEIVTYFKWKGPVGLTFPAVVQNGVIRTASNIDKSWIGVDAAKLIFEKTNLPTYIINDADAAGMAEMKFGAGKEIRGTVLIVTVGTGIGSALFTRGKLISNTELGHIYLNTGVDAEDVTSDAVRKKEGISWEDWAKRFDVYLHEMERLFWPELIIIGGGVSKKTDDFLSLLTIKTEIAIAETKNEAGIIGAALSVKANRDLFSWFS
jgi:polyphosphate glucokinase